MRYEFSDITCFVSQRRSLIPSGRYLVFLWLCLTAVTLLACTTLPKPGIKSLTLAYEPHPDRRLATVSRDLLKGVGPETSGFFMLLRNNEALQWRLLLDDKVSLIWKSGDKIIRKEPAHSFWQRFQSGFFGLFDLDNQL